MKKYLLMVILVMSLVACSGDENSTTSNTSREETADTYAVITAENVSAISEARSFAISEFPGISTDVEISPDSVFAAIALSNNVIIFSIANTDITPLTLTGHEGAVTGIAYSPDGTRLASASADKTVRIWDVSNGETVTTVTNPDDEAFELVTFSPDGSLIVANAPFSNIYVMSAYSGEIVSSMVILGNTTIGDIAFSPDGLSLITASGDSTLRYWDAASGIELRQLLVETGSIGSMALNSAGTRLVATNGVLPGISIYDVVTGNIVIEVAPPHITPKVVYNPDDTFFVTYWNFQGAQIGVYNTTTGEQISTETTLPTGSIDALAFSPDGTSIVTVGVREGITTLSMWRVTE